MSTGRASCKTPRLGDFLKILPFRGFGFWLVDFRSDGDTFCPPRGCLKRPKNEGQAPPISYLWEAHIFSTKNKTRGFYISCQQELFPQVKQHYGSLPKRYRKLLYVFEMVGGGELFALSCAAFSGASASIVHQKCLYSKYIFRILEADKQTAPCPITILVKFLY